MNVAALLTLVSQILFVLVVWGTRPWVIVNI